MTARERRVLEEEEALARGAHRVLSDPEGDIPSTDVGGQSPSGRRARGEGGEAGQARGKPRQMHGRGAGEAEGARRPASPSPDWDSESPPPRRYGPQLVRNKPGMVRWWRAGDVAELLRYVK